MLLLGLWSARAGGARPRFHRFAGYDAEPFDDRAVGARPALERGAQAGGRVAPSCRSVELLSRELGVPIYKLEQWREKADAALDGALKEREATPRAANWPPRCSASASSASRSSCCARRIGRPGPLARRRSR